MKIIIVAGGALSIEFIKEQIERTSPTMILCADSGADMLYKAKILPDILLGDFDSINQETLEYFALKGIKTVRFKSEKDVTDTEIAIDYAVKNGADDVLILGATGSRLDHTLSNIFILEKYCETVRCKIKDLNNTIEVLKNEKARKIKKEDYQYLSLLPLSNHVKGVTTKGLKYPLNNATLKRSDSYGISNEIKNETGTISMTEGVMAVIQSKD